MHKFVLEPGLRDVKTRIESSATEALLLFGHTNRI